MVRLKMLLLWRGNGLVAVLGILFAVAFVSIGIATFLRLDPGVATPLIFVAVGVVTWLAGRRLNSGLTPAQSHSFFLIPVQWWGLIWIGFAIYAFGTGEGH